MSGHDPGESPVARAVLGDFARREDAEAAVRRFRTEGVPTGDISVILETPREEAAGRDRGDVGSGIFTGAASGAILGGLAGWLLSLGAFGATGVAQTAARYAGGSTLLGASLGGVLLGLLGGAAGLGFRTRATSTVQPPDVLITVRGRTLPTDRIEQLMREYNALNVQSTDDLPDRRDDEPKHASGSLPHADPDAQPETADAGMSAAGTPMVASGQDVYTLDDEKLGSVQQVSGDYFTVKRGMFHDDLYVPFEHLSELRGDRVYVNAVRDEVALRGWQDPPLHREHQGQGPTRP